MKTYLLIGTGVAAIAAAEAIRSQDRGGEIVLLGDDPHGYYSRPGLAYYITGELAEQHLRPLPEEYFRKLNLRFVQGRAVQVQHADKKVRLQDGRLLPYDRLLIAVGAEASRSKSPGADLQGVYKLDNMEDARNIIRAARKARSAVVVGGGITALELVEGLICRNVKTTYFLRGDRYWSNVLDENESRIVEHRLKEDGVNILFHTELDEILGKGGRVAGVRTTGGREIRCDLVAIAIGIKPRTRLAQDSGIEVDRGILVDEYMRTNIPDVFAAGDVAQVFDPLTGKAVLDSLWGPARDQGTAAGLNMAGKPTVYCKLVPFNVTRLAGLTTTIIGMVGRGDDEDLVGIARGDSETWRQLPDAIAAQSDFDVNHLRILVGENTVLGAIVMGDQTLSHPLHHLALEHVDISPIRQQLLQPNAPLADVLIDFWTQYSYERSGSAR